MIEGIIVDEAFRQRLAYGSFVSRKHRIFYLETPKALCTSMKWLLAIIEGVRVPLVWKVGESQIELCIHYRDVHPLPPVTALPAGERDDVLTGGGYRRMCIVRNPYARLLSAWSNKVCQLEPKYAEVSNAAIRHAGRTPTPDDMPSFAEFATWVLETNDPRTCDPHWRSQRELLRPDLVAYTDVLRFESIADELDAFLRAGDTTARFDARKLLAGLRFNESVAIDVREQYDEAIASRVAAFYADDFARFGYDRDSWRNLGSGYTPAKTAETALRAVRARNRLLTQLGQVAALHEAQKAQAQIRQLNAQLTEERNKVRLLEAELAKRHSNG